MATVSAVANLDALLKPISDEHPAGQDLSLVILDKGEGVYWHDAIRKAHREDPYAQEPKLPDWPAVIDLSIKALTEHTKDLQIAAWLADAITRHDKHDRLAGLRDGIRLMRGLIEGFWDGVYPAIDPGGEDGGLAARANIISRFESSLAVALKHFPLTEAASGQKFSYFQWESSKKLDAHNPAAIEKLFTGEEIARYTSLKENWPRAVSVTSHAFLKERLDLFNECWDELMLLDAAVDEKFGKFSPGVRQLRVSLDDVWSLVRKLELEKCPAPMRTKDGNPVNKPEAPEPNDGPGGGSGEVRSRQDAFRQLNEVAAYFRRAEPHSPVPYLLELAVKWGNMTLDAWLNDAVKDTSVLYQIRERLGMKPENDGGG